jgi:hypothetical protein
MLYVQHCNLCSTPHAEALIVKLVLTSSTFNSKYVWNLFKKGKKYFQGQIQHTPTGAIMSVHHYLPFIQGLDTNSKNFLLRAQLYPYVNEEGLQCPPI